MLRGGPIYWLVFVLCFLPFVLYQNAMRDGNAPRLNPIEIGAFAALTPLVAWFVGRIAEDAFKGAARKWRYSRENIRAQGAISRGQVTYNPMTWSRPHQIALALAVVIGTAIGVVVGYMVGAVGSGAGGFMRFDDWLTYNEGYDWRPSFAVWWGLAGALIGAAWIYVGRLK